MRKPFGYHTTLSSPRHPEQPLAAWRRISNSELISCKALDKNNVGEGSPLPAYPFGYSVQYPQFTVLHTHFPQAVEKSVEK